MNEPETKPAAPWGIDAINRVSAKLQVAEAFAEKYGPNIPEGLAFLSFDMISVAPKVLITARPYGADAMDRFSKDRPLSDRLNHDRALAATGEIFGRQGWTRNLNYERTTYHWTKPIDGVEVTIMDAESVNDPLNGSPVLPAAFPMLLKDAEA